MSKYDKEKILTIEDLGDMVPFFRNCFGRAIGKWLMQVLGVNEINNVNADLIQLRGPDFAEEVLHHSSINVSYRVYGEENLELMREGQFLTVSNHPFGGIDGLILVSLIGRLRPDYKVLVNYILSQIPSLQDMWVPVVPNMESNKKYVHDRTANFKSLRELAREFGAGYPIGLFPAGGVGRISMLNGLAIERPWKSTSLRILHRADRPIFPIMFDGRNSNLFYYLKGTFPIISDLMLPREILRKWGETIDVYVGKPILPEEWKDVSGLEDFRKFLMERALGVLPRAMYEPEINGRAVLLVDGKPVKSH